MKTSEEKGLLKEGIDAALLAQITKLVQNWMVEPAVQQPERAYAGIRQAIEIWQEACKALEKGEI